MVDGGAYSYELNICKPDFRIFNILLEKYNLVPEETIFIDDNLHNIQASNELKLNGVLFDNFENVKKHVYDIIKKA